MHKVIKHALWGVVVAGGITLLGATAANAAETDGEDGILSGTQAIIPVSVPVDIVGNAVSVLGISTVEAPAPAPAPAPAEPAAAPAPAPEATTGGAEGVASGTQAVATLDVPVTVQDNAVSVLGSSSAGTPAAVPQSDDPQSSPSAAPQTDAPAAGVPSTTTSGVDSLLGGTQALLQVNVPITVTGNSVAVLGTSDASTADGAAMPASSADGSSTAPVPDAVTDGSDSIAGGTQVISPVTAPITVTGNAISVLGTSTVPGSGNGAVGTVPASGGDIVTSGRDSVLGGTQIAAPISIPLTIGGNAISLIGTSTVTDPGPGTTPTDPGTDPGTGPGTDPCRREGRSSAGSRRARPRRRR